MKSNLPELVRGLLCEQESGPLILHPGACFHLACYTLTLFARSEGSQFHLLKNWKQCRRPHEADTRLEGIAL